MLKGSVCIQDVEGLSDESETSETSQDSAKTPRQWLVLLILGSGNLLVAGCMSLQAPFFPQEAESKNLSPKEYGILFGTYYLTVFIFAHLSAKLLEYASPKFTFIAGLFSTGVCYILFGVLHEAPGGLTYKVLAFLIRLVEGVGSGACKTSSSTIVISEFPNKVATTFAHLELYFGVGLLLGPIVGGVLYQSGGFASLFMIFGVCLVCCTIVAIVLLPDDSEVSSQEPLVSKSSLRFWLNGTVVIQYLCVLCACTCVGFNQAALEPHLRQFSLSPVAVGLVFVVSGGVYALTSPLWGSICQIQSCTKVTSCVGCILILLSFLLIGPVKFIQIETQLWMIVFSLFIFGLGLGATLVSAFTDILKDAMRRGFPANLSTYSLASAVFSSAVALGYFGGPMLGGFLLEKVGYREGTVIFLYTEGTLLCLLCFYVLCENNKSEWPLDHDRSEWPSESEYLLSSGTCDTFEFPFKSGGFHAIDINATRKISVTSKKKGKSLLEHAGTI